MNLQFFGGRGSSSGKGGGGSPASERAFLNKFDDLADKTAVGNFVRINEMRDELGWSRSRFDDMLKSLRDKGVIQLMESDVTLMSDREINGMFVDENGFRQGTILRVDRLR